MPSSSTPPRVFHVVYFKDREVQLALDAIRFAGNEQEKMRAHITIGGPFQLRKEVPAASDALDGVAVPLRGTGTFFEGTQNTVFLDCAPDQLEPFENIRKYKFRPHITLYDGESRRLANRILDIADQTKLASHIVVKKPEIYETVKGQKTLWLQGYFDEASELFNIKPPRAPASDWTESQRASLVAKFFACLADK